LRRQPSSGLRFSLVEVPIDAADHIVKAMRGMTLRGQKVQVRRDRDRAI
jgi:hypothetical protein